MYHFHSTHIGRSKCRSAVQLAGYVSGSMLNEEFIDQDSGIVAARPVGKLDRDDVVYSEILMPEKAPSWAKDREVLWNKIQNEFDVRRNSVFCQHADIALPVELSKEENIALIKRYVEKNLLPRGIIADTNVHIKDPEDHNPHAHLILTTREIIEARQICKDGSSLLDYTFGKKVREWDTKHFLKHELRRLWAIELNQAYKEKGINKEVSHLSYKERGITLTPGIKEGPARHMKSAERAALNQQIEQQNRQAIIENPELIIDKLVSNKVVFTKEIIEKELFEIICGNGKNLSVGEQISNRKLDLFLASLEKVMSSSRLKVIEARDIEGRQLYTDSKRYELEQELAKIVRDIKHIGEEEGVSQGDNAGSNGRALIRSEDLDKRSGLEELHIRLNDLIGKNDRRELTVQQRNAVLSVVNGDQVSVVEGLPGAGKTYLMKEVARQYRKQGKKIIGVAVSESATRELQASIGGPAYNTAKLRKELSISEGREFNLNLSVDYYKDLLGEDGNKSGIDKLKQMLRDVIGIGVKLDKDTVLIIDEASMVDLREMHYFLKKALEAKAKVVFLGDSNQLPSVGIGGGYEHLKDQVGVILLDEVRRQKDDAHKEAVKLMSQYRIAEAVDKFRLSGEVFKFANGAESVVGELVDCYVQNYKEILSRKEDKNRELDKPIGPTFRDIVALATTNAEVSALNTAIRNRLKQDGVVGAVDKEFLVDINGKEVVKGFAVGDRVIFNRNRKSLGVNNNDVGEIIGFGRSRDYLRDTICVAVEKGKGKILYVEVDPERYEYFDHGYAMTVHKSQGKTYERVLGLISSSVGYTAFNVMASRHEYNLRCFVDANMCRDNIYRKVDNDIERVKAEYDLTLQQSTGLSNLSEDEKILYTGLIEGLSRFTDSRMAVDHEQYEFSPERKALKEYIDSRNEVIRLKEKIELWVSKEKAYDEHASFCHSPDYLSFLSSLKKRESLASHIVDNIVGHKDILSASGIRLSSVEKHARKEYALQYRFEDNRASAGAHVSYDLMFGINHINKLHQEIVSNVCEDNSESVSESKSKVIESIEAHTVATEKAGLLLDKASEIHEHIEELKNQIYEKEAHISKEYENHEKAKLYVRAGREYLNHGFNVYLKSVFNSSPEEVLKKWMDVKRSSFTSGQVNMEQALEKIKSNPELLGDLKGLGIGGLSLSVSRAKAKENIEVIGQKFALYEEYLKELPVKEDLIKQNSYIKSADKIRAEQQYLKWQLPERVLENYVKELATLGDNCVWQDTLNRLSKLEEGRLASGRREGSRDGVLQQKIIENLGEQKLREGSLVAKDRLEAFFGEKKSGVSNMESTASNGPVYRDRVIKELFYKQGKLLGLDGRERISELYQDLVPKLMQLANPADEFRNTKTGLARGSLQVQIDRGDNGNIERIKWWRYSRGRGGDLVNLVMEAGVAKDKEEALDFIRGYFEGSKQLTPTHYTNYENDIKWEKFEDIDSYMVKVPEKTSFERVLKKEPDLPNFRSYVLEKHSYWANKIEDVYTYTDKDGNVLNNICRIKGRDGKKIILPFTPGIEKVSSGTPVSNTPILAEGLKGNDTQNSKEVAWYVGGMVGDNRPLYNLPELLAEKKKPVLVVEGEKAAKYAKESGMFDGFVSVTWSGGANSVEKTDWSPLYGKQIVILPDNDAAGVKAAGTIETILKDKAWVAVVDTKELGLPEKWDIADPLPMQHIERLKSAIEEKASEIHIKDVSIRLDIKDPYLHYMAGEEYEALEKATEGGLDSRGINTASEYKSRLAEELKVIKQTGFSEDFLIAANIKRFCDLRNIAVGEGRGSACSSLVAYSVGIHNVDPVKHGLIFERFLTEGDSKHPDIDMDVEALRRDEVVEFVLNSYPDRSGQMLRVESKDEEGNVVKTNIHNSAVGILPNGFNKEQVNIKQEDNRVVFDHLHGELEGKGVKKFDLLSSKYLDKIKQVEALIKDKHNIEVDWEKADMQSAIKLLSSGKISNIFQLQNQNPTEFSKLKIEGFEDVVNALAVIRPAATKYQSYFTESAIKEDRKLNTPDPKGIFTDTRGVVLFQEQVMQAAVEYFGMSISDAATLRRDLQKGIESNLTDKQQCISRASKNGLAPQDAEVLFNSLKEAESQGYSFNKAHAVGYAQVLMKAAYLKANFKEEFNEVFLYRDNYLKGKQLYNAYGELVRDLKVDKITSDTYYKPDMYKGIINRAQELCYFESVNNEEVISSKRIEEIMHRAYHEEQVKKVMQMNLDERSGEISFTQRLQEEAKIVTLSKIAGREKEEGVYDGTVALRHKYQAELPERMQSALGQLSQLEGFKQCSLQEQQAAAKCMVQLEWELGQPLNHKLQLHMVDLGKHQALLQEGYMNQLSQNTSLNATSTQAQVKVAESLAAIKALEHRTILEANKDQLMSNDSYMNKVRENTVNNSAIELSQQMKLHEQQAEKAIEQKKQERSMYRDLDKTME